jgi:acyl carrier protein
MNGPMADAPTVDSIERELCGEIQTLRSLAAGTVTPDSTLASLGIDSLKLVSLLLAIEQKFGVNLMKKGLKPEDMKSVRSLAAAVRAGRAA